MQSLGSLSDDELMNLIKNGNSKAFETLFERHSSKVMGYAKRLLGNLSRAEDVSQEVWLKIARNANTYQSQSSFIAWLFTIVRNTAFSTKRDSKVLDEASTIDDGSASFEKESIEEILSSQNKMEEVKKAVDSLPESQRVVLVTWMSEDLSYNEIAKEYGLTLSQVKSLLFRAKKNLELKLVKGQP